MSIIYCHKHDVTFDSDFNENCIDCIEEEVEREHDVQVAPGIWQSKEDYEANRDYDAMKDGENFV